MKKTINSKGKKFRIEILKIDEDYHLTKQEKIDYHTWHKDVDNPVDNVHRIYIDDRLAETVDGEIDFKTALKLKPVIETIEMFV